MSRYRNEDTRIQELTVSDTRQLLNQFLAPKSLVPNPHSRSRFYYGNGGTLYLAECLDSDHRKVRYLVAALDDGRGYISQPYRSEVDANNDFLDIVESMKYDSRPLNESVDSQNYGFQSRKWLME